LLAGSVEVWDLGMNARLEKKIAVVTGAGRGIGKELATLIASEGAKVIVNDLDPETVTKTVTEIKQLGLQCSGFPGDVTKQNFAQDLADFTRDQFGDVHIIVNNAGYVWNDRIHHVSDEQWDAMHDIHLKAPFQILRAFYPLIAEQVSEERKSGRPQSRKIINISSISATRGAAGQSPYSAAKAGLFGLTKSLAKEWGHMNVTVNCVAFGLVDTRLTKTANSQTDTIDLDGRKMNVGFTTEQKDSIVKSIPLGYSASPKMAAGGAFILSLPEADYITGQCFEIAGGIIY